MSGERGSGIALLLTRHVDDDDDDVSPFKTPATMSKKSVFSSRERTLTFFASIKHYYGARGVMVIVVGNGHGDTSSNPGRGLLHFI